MKHTTLAIIALSVTTFWFGLMALLSDLRLNDSRLETAKARIDVRIQERICMDLENIIYAMQDMGCEMPYTEPPTDTAPMHNWILPQSAGSFGVKDST